ncbi:MAG: cytidylate kinase-like family protein [Firmicutes bacterium]|nr:cytidylate kinase-like family protein [Bacillota bacterium]
MRIITVSREFGSGGREVGKRLADALGIAYYDREIIAEVAEKSALDEGYVEYALGQGLLNNFRFTFSHTFSHAALMNDNVCELFMVQNKVLRQLAQNGDCVIVGRSADAVLEELQPLKLFVYADLPSKIARCRQRAAEGETMTDREIEKLIRQVDKARANYHSIVANTGWGKRESYHLCLNTTGLEIKEFIPLLADYAEKWFAARDRAQAEAEKTAAEGGQE